MSTPTDFSGEDLIDDAESDAVHDALRANLGLTEDRDVNAARLQQASDFVALVNARLPAATALSPGLIARLRRWIVGGDEAKFPRSAWPTWALAGGLVALVGVGLGVGVAFFSTDNPVSVAADSTTIYYSGHGVQVAPKPNSVKGEKNAGVAESSVAVAPPSDAATVYRGDGSGKVVAVADVKVAAAQLATSLVSLGCNAATREVRDTVYVDIDVTPSGCHDALPVIAKLGFVPEANGRLAIRFVPEGK